MKRFALVGLVLMMAAVAFPSTARAGQWVIGAGVGSNTVNIDSDFDESDLGWKAFAGYRFRPWIGVEAQYVEFGSPDNEDFEVDLSDLGIYGLGIWPIGKHFEIFGKLGYHLWDVEVEDVSLNETASDDDWDFSYGAGLAFVFGSEGHFGIRAEYEEFEVEDTDSVSMASASFEFRF